MFLEVDFCVQLMTFIFISSYQKLLGIIEVVSELLNYNTHFVFHFT